ncbi:hypothetical protein NA57DRAFT_75496 [Rhizodiscina lignyota]|uniref:HAUS augmin-like complex subunit 1 n=1 Tax=Rhizodiscina lignyota TaxID=1504668 RepID=A0A9P4IIN3_9PEZI|nr:hypothetical protein NA57DRAFT_75496 [Rhizodiscina lignyota]
MDPTLTPHFSLSFSPSKARAQRAQAADWAQIDSWLSSKYQGRSVPLFERNEDTLKALLALVAANEKADEEREVLWTVEKRTLAEVEADLERSDDDAAILEALRMHLSPDAQQSLDALAACSVAIDSPRPGAESTAHTLIQLTTQSHALSQQLHRLNHLHSYLQSQMFALRAQLRDIQPSKDTTANTFSVPLSLPQQTQEWTRNTKMLKAKVAEYEERLNALSASLPGSEYSVGVEDVVELENEVVDMRKRVNQLESQIKGFEGLPPDRDAARKEVKRIEKEVELLKRERDKVFAEMVGK